MIRIRVSKDFFTAIFTPGVTGLHECIQGLPPSVTELVDVDIENDHVVMVFDDGNYDDIFEESVVFAQASTNPRTVTKTGYSNPNDAFDAASGVI